MNIIVVSCDSLLLIDKTINLISISLVWNNNNNKKEKKKNNDNLFVELLFGLQ